MSGHITRIGAHVRDITSGIAGRVIAVCHYEHDAPQFRIKRYGVNSSGSPFEPVWACVADCVPVSEEAARHE